MSILISIAVIAFLFIVTVHGFRFDDIRKAVLVPKKQESGSNLKKKGAFNLGLPKKQSGSNFKKKAFNLGARELVGALPPTGYFDPLGLSETYDVKKLREAELKHGRVAMLAFTGILIAEKWHPLFEGHVFGAGIYHFQQVENEFRFWPFLLLPIAVFEIVGISKVINKNL
jgi:Chlorophyll A-B binding protein